MFGFATIVDQSDYKEIFQDGGFDCDPYTFLVYTQMIHANRRVREEWPQAKLSLFFEAGHKAQKNASQLLSSCQNDKFGGANIIDGYSFVKKEKSYPTQAADLIAWNIRKGYQNTRDEKPVSKDTLALIGDKTIVTMEYNRERLIKTRDDILEKTGCLKYASDLLLANRI